MQSYISELELLCNENHDYKKFLIQKIPILVTPDSKNTILFEVFYGKYKSYFNASTWKDFKDYNYEHAKDLFMCYNKN